MENQYLTLDKYLIEKAQGKNFDATIDHIVNSILNAENKVSKINSETTEGKELLELQGFTGIKTRHFYNNICSRENTNYLEIGCWYGSSSVSAIYKNKIKALFIDNWCQFNGNVGVFTGNIKKFNHNLSKCSLIESDCWKVDIESLKSIGPFNIYLYDGEHTYLDQYKALEYYLPVLSDTFIFIVDDWNWDAVQNGTNKAIEDLKLQIKFKHEIFVEDTDNMPNHSGKLTWWTGICIFLLSKN